MRVSVAVAAVAAMVVLSGCSSEPAVPSVIGADLAARSSIPPAEAGRCVECHSFAVDQWKGSHHARANRMVSAEMDDKAFDPPHRLEVGSFVSEFKKKGDRFEISQTGPDGKTSYHYPEAVIAITPLLQYLVPFPRGRLQVTEMAYDPRSNEWFNVYGEQNRMPHEWGFWKNRGMTWNVQCAFCHTTTLEKGYEPETDTYHTTWDAMGISCKQCHGETRAHITDPTAACPEETLTAEQAMHNCASCHARREELTGKFKAGENFFDHFRPSLADSEVLYYQDGQVLDEDFVWSSFLTSRLSHQGITCLDCHEPHSGNVIVPGDHNGLCMTCHTAPGLKGAKPIDPETHTHHEPDNAGQRCVGCHMPYTTYMERDPRRDHGFISPDPLLTKELGIPNACNRCHTAEDETVDWAIEWTDKWYGERMNRLTRRRARAIARAQQSDLEVLPELLELARTEEIAAWRAILLNLLHQWADRPEVASLLQESLKHDHPLVRSSAVQGLAPLPGSYRHLEPMRRDPSRLVRIDAAWSTLNSMEREEVSYGDLMDYINFTCDQPAGALRKARLALVEGRPEEAESWAQKAADWDQSPHAMYSLGTVQNAVGNSEEAMDSFRRAAEMAPENAIYPYSMALVAGEMDQPLEALEALKESIRLDPEFGRAWYNLGLAHAQLDQLQEAVAALRKAVELMPESTDPNYALATVYLRMGDTTQARQAAQAVLDREPDHGQARSLLRNAARSPEKQAE